MPKLRLPFSALLAFLLLLFFVGKSYLEIRDKAQRLQRLKEEVAALQEKKKEFEDDLAYRQSADYIEKEAREQLGYVKEGEVIIVLPDLESSNSAVEGQAEGQSKSPPSSQEYPKTPNWMLWHRLFFGQ